MNIVVLIKEVPDMNKVKFDREKGTVNRASAEAEINPFDLNALQAAVDLKKITGAKITALTMGPPKAVNSLRDAYARGADELILLTDRKFGGSDTFATSLTIASGIKNLKQYDIVICGEKSVDGDTAQVGAEVAEFLDLPHAYHVNQITDINDGYIDVITDKMGGYNQRKRLSLPALISVSKNINLPELPTVKRKLKSLSEEVKLVGLSDLSEFMSEEDAGFKGSPTKVTKIEVPEEEHRVSEIYRDNLEGFLEVVYKRFEVTNVIGGQNEKL